MSPLDFTATYTDLFIAISVAAVVSYRFGWRSTVLGILAGTVITLLVAPMLRSSATGMAAHGLSALMLLSFGVYLVYAFIAGLSLRDDGQPTPFVNGVGWGHRLNLPGLVMSAWASVAQGMAVVGTWQSAWVQDNTASASLGLAIGVIILGLMAWAFSTAGILRRLPAYVADGLSAFAITAYGACFLALAVGTV